MDKGRVVRTIVKLGCWEVFLGIRLRLFLPERCVKSIFTEKKRLISTGIWYTYIHDIGVDNRLDIDDRIA